MPNPNLTSGQKLPGFYAFIDYNAQGVGIAPNNRLLLFAFENAVGQRTPNVPFQPAQQQEVDDGCGRGSDAATMYAAAVSQPEAQGAEIWVCPIAEPAGGVASVYKFTVFVSGTNPAKPGTIQLWASSRQVPAVGFSTSDTQNTIASAIQAALSTMLDSPFGTVTVATNVVTIPYMHKGTTGEDFPFRCWITPNGSGVTLSPGQILFATNATGAGSVVVNFGSISVTTVLSGGETPAQVATKVAASFAGNTYALMAVVDGTTPAQVDLLFQNNWDVRRISAAVVTTTGLTANLGSGATSGTGSPTSFTYNGTQGTGLPTLTTALANLAASNNPYRSWASTWNDSTTLGALATNIEAGSNGSITGQKQQVLTVADFQAASVDGTIITGTTPNLTSTPPHYGFLWSPDVPVQAFEIASRVAAARAATWLSQPQKNWNGFQVRGNTSRAPILIPPAVPSRDQQNTALRTYALAPVVVGPSGNLETVKGRSTSLAGDTRLWAWSTESQAAYHATNLGQRFQARFNQASIIRYSEPKAPGIFDAQSFTDATLEAMRAWEREGNYDGADAFANAVISTPDNVNPFRVNVEYPESPVLDLDQVAFTGHYTSPAA